MWHTCTMCLRITPRERGTNRASVRNTGSVWKLFRSNAFVKGVYLGLKGQNSEYDLLPILRVVPKI